MAVRREVLAAVSNKNIFHMLQLYIDGVPKGAQVPNALVVALDEARAHTHTDAWGVHIHVAGVDVS